VGRALGREENDPPDKKFGWKVKHNTTIPPGWKPDQDHNIPNGWKKRFDDQTVPMGWKHEQDYTLPPGWKVERDVTLPPGWKPDQDYTIPIGWKRKRCEDQTVPDGWKQGQDYTIPIGWTRRCCDDATVPKGWKQEEDNTVPTGQKKAEAEKHGPDESFLKLSTRTHAECDPWGGGAADFGKFVKIGKTENRESSQMLCSRSCVSGKLLPKLLGAQLPELLNFGKVWTRTETREVWDRMFAVSVFFLVGSLDTEVTNLELDKKTMGLGGIFGETDLDIALILGQGVRF
jgi:hypothetical protein